MDTLIGIFVVVVAFGLYMLPSIVAMDRGHPHFLAIVALNLLTGWTGWGWVAAFVWSLASRSRAPYAATAIIQGGQLSGVVAYGVASVHISRGDPRLPVMPWMITFMREPNPKAGR